MSKTVYAGVAQTENRTTCFGPVVPFAHHAPTRLKAGIQIADTYTMDCEAYEAAHEPNPDYVEHASIDMANGNADTVFGAIGFTLEDGGSRFPIEDVYQALLKRLNASRPLEGRMATISGGFDRISLIECALPAAAIRMRLEQIFHIAKEGRRRGATHIVVV